MMFSFQRNLIAARIIVIDRLNENCLHTYKLINWNSMLTFHPLYCVPNCCHRRHRCGPLLKTTHISMRSWDACRFASQIYRFSPFLFCFNRFDRFIDSDWNLPLQMLLLLLWLSPARTPPFTSESRLCKFMKNRYVLTHSGKMRTVTLIGGHYHLEMMY